ncbi:hypothetical protein [Streptomyces sp. NPDC048272]|uniref:hypothetical protein n=1 Tax=Streptomyces sp. NPDC048272 TaxID=3154616 RepID=UPI003441696D
MGEDPRTSPPANSPWAGESGPGRGGRRPSPSRGEGAVRTAGYRVSLLGITDTVKDLARELGGIATVGSLTEPDDLARLVDVTLERYSRIDAVVDGAGTPGR